MSTQPELLPVRPQTAVMQRVHEGFGVLAALFHELDGIGEEGAAAQQHVTAATRELAAVQRMFERRVR